MARVRGTHLKEGLGGACGRACRGPRAGDVIGSRAEKFREPPASRRWSLTWCVGLQELTERLATYSRPSECSRGALTASIDRSCSSSIVGRVVALSHRDLLDEDVRFVGLELVQDLIKGLEPGGEIEL